MKYMAKIIGGFLDGETIGFENKPIGFDFDERANGVTFRVWRYKIKAGEPFTYELGECISN